MKFDITPNPLNSDEYIVSLRGGAVIVIVASKEEAQKIKKVMEDDEKKDEDFIVFVQKAENAHIVKGSLELADHLNNLPKKSTATNTNRI